MEGQYWIDQAFFFSYFVSNKSLLRNSQKFLSNLIFELYPFYTAKNLFSIQSKKENVVICDTCDLSLTKGAEISRLYNIVIAWQIFITLFNSTQQCHKLKKVMTGLQNEPS